VELDAAGAASGIDCTEVVPASEDSMGTEVEASGVPESCCDVPAWSLEQPATANKAPSAVIVRSRVELRDVPRCAGCEYTRVILHKLCQMAHSVPIDPTIVGEIGLIRRM
jgi:hypothetical protein